MHGGLMDFDEIVIKVKELSLPIGKYALFGSVPLTAYGIRESRDIDILITSDLFNELKESGKWVEKTNPNGDKKLVKEPFDLTDKWWHGNSYEPEESKIIRDAEIIKGMPVVRLAEVLSWKRAFWREKDLKDVRLIEEYLEKHGSSTKST